MQKSAFERTGLVPRSIIRTFDRFRRQLLPGAEDLVIQEFRVSKYQVLVSVRCLASLLFFPLLVNYLVKTTILVPLAEYIWNTQQSEIFLNFYQENRAFLEMRDFEEKTFFESLVSTEPKQSDYDTLHFADKTQVLHKTQNSFNPIRAQHAKLFLAKPVKFIERVTFQPVEKNYSIASLPPKNEISKFLSTKTKEPKLNEINFERFRFLSKSKFNRASSNFLTNNLFFKEDQTNGIQGYDAESTIATGDQSTTNCGTHYGGCAKTHFCNTIAAGHNFATPIKGKQKQETASLTATKNGSLVALPQLREAPWCSEKKRVLFSNQENIVPVLGEPENSTKFDFVKQNLPTAHFIEDKTAFSHLMAKPQMSLHFAKQNVSGPLVPEAQLCRAPLNCQEDLCGQTIHFLSENKKIKSFSKLNASQEGNIFASEKTKKREILLQKKFQEKTIQLATFYNQQTISAIANVFGDFVTLITIAFLFVLMKPQIIILKSFLTESIYSLSDTTKSFLLILLTDLLVGFHSPRGWEILIEILLRHFGLPENQDFVFLFVATLPVLLDTVFKYWIFRYLNQISPSTVATYHSMIE